MLLPQKAVNKGLWAVKEHFTRSTLQRAPYIAVITKFGLLNMSRSNLINILGYLGLIPFLVPSYLMAEGFFYGAGLQSAAIFGLYAPYVFIAYSAIILSFLSGTLWGHARQADAMPSGDGLLQGAIVFSNLVALSAWASLLLIYIAPIMTLFAVCLLMAGYLGLLLLEGLVIGPQQKQYWAMRIRLTSVVALTHLIAILLMLTEL